MLFRVKRIISLILIVVMIVSISGCSNFGLSSQSMNNKTTIKIGVALYDQFDTFISTIQNNIEQIANNKALEDKIKITVNAVDAKGSQSLQENQVDLLLEQGYDVLCVNMVDRTAASVIIDKAKVADTPVVFFNREPVEEDMQRWNQLYYVGVASSEAGIMQGNIIAAAYQQNPAKIDLNGDGKLQYVMLEGEPGHQDALIRTEHCIKSLTNRKIQVEKLASDNANWNRAQASTKMKQWIELFGDEIEVVFSNNDDMALGAIDALKQEGIINLPAIVGVDGTPPALEAVKNKQLMGTVLSDSKKQAQVIFDLAYALATGADVNNVVDFTSDKYVRIPHALVNTSNVDSFR